MITSDKQYEAAKQQLARLAESLTAPTKRKVPDVVANAGKAQIRELMAELQHDLDEYERLRNSRPEDIEIHSLDDLLTTPIRYRIAAHISVDEFSRKVGVSARQIIRYETEEYQNITTNTLQKILKGLNIHLEGKVA
jgi:DNA-binding Xre family transcriptional regulator